MKFWLYKLSPPGGLKSSIALKWWWNGLWPRSSWVGRRVGCLIFGLILTLVFPAFAEKPTVAAGAGIAATNSMILDPAWKVGSWIWTTETYDQQLCRFWRTFEIPPDSVVEKARFRIAADNSYTLFLDGQELGRGSFWRDLMEYDLSALSLKPGVHVLAVEAFNDFGAAGILTGLQLDLADGKAIEVASDSTWRIVPNSKKGWEKMTQAPGNWPTAKIMQVFGGAPWDKKPYLFKATQLPHIAIRFWQTGWFQFASLSLCAIALVICIRLLGKLAVHVQSGQIMRRERARIARDLHDDLTSGLTQLVLLGEVARRELPEESQSHQQVSRVCEKARNLSRSLNEIIWMVNSQRDTLQDFASYLCKYAETFMRSTTIRCRFDLGGEIADLPFDLGMRRNLFLAVKEALNNVARHSGATEVTVRIQHQEMAVMVVIEDNGKGFVTAEADCDRNGLSNIMKRAADAGGTCSIKSQPGSGCRVEFIVPLARRVQGRFRQGFRIMRGQPPFESKAQGPVSATTLTPKKHSSNSAL